MPWAVVLVAAAAAHAMAPTAIASAPTGNRLLLGMDAFAAGELDTAAQHFQHVTMQSSGNDATVAFQQLALCRMSQGRYRDAAKAIHDAIDTMSDESDDWESAHLTLGRVYEHMGHGADAASALLQIQPLPSAGKLMLGNIMSDSFGDVTTALKLYEDVCDDEEAADTTAFWLCGVACSTEGDHERAATCFARAADLAAPEGDSDVELQQLILAERSGALSTDESVRGLRAALPGHVLRSWDYVRQARSQQAVAAALTFDRALYSFTFDMVQLAVQNACVEGLVLEFGVFHGKSVRMLAQAYPDQPVHGFDTFSGLPIPWHDESEGSYSTHGELPAAPSNVEYHKGTFDETLPGFLEAHEGAIKLMNVDCDLYESTRDIFDQVHSRVVVGTVMVFDEYVMNEHWEEDEFKAFQEAVKDHGWEYEYLGVSLVSKQAVVRITGVRDCAAAGA